MLKSLIAGVTAVSLTMATATPLAAENHNNDVAATLIIGLATAALIGAVVKDSPDDTVTQVDHSNGWSGIDRNNSWSGLNAQHNRRAVPASCLRGVDTRFGTYRMFGQRCLEQNYHYVSSLPNRCSVRVYTANGPRNGYDPHCLREQGYRSDRRN